MKKIFRRFLTLAFWAYTVAFLALVVSMLLYIEQPLSMQQPTARVHIEHGSNLKSIADTLVDAGIIGEPWRFILLAKLSDQAAKLQAGDYEVEAPITAIELIEILSHGKTSQEKIQFIEGKTFAEMRDKLNQHPAIKHLTTHWTAQDIAKAVAPEMHNPEGWFYPDTYLFDAGTTDLDLLKRAHQQMVKKLSAAWLQRDDYLPYQTPYHALIMASIIEKETAVANERTQIAGVFINRLNEDMRLQTDPTVIYGMGKRFHGNISRDDLSTDTPYNTYTRDGLPPTPIAMPGLAAIEAALHPANTKALYFVANGKGQHVFSNSLAEHNQAVARYQQAH